MLVDLMSPAEKWAGLGDAFQVDARINVFAQVDATIVPTGALFRRGENWTVYVVKDGRAEIKDVKLLRRSGRVAAVASGLAAGESVVVYPGDRVASGVRVEVRQTGDSR